jgi:excisionase family DNA binding protein
MDTLIELRAEQAATRREDRAHRVSQVAELFGMSTRHVWRLIERGDLRAERLSARCIRIFDSEIARYRESLRSNEAA